MRAITNLLKPLRHRVERPVAGAEARDQRNRFALAYGNILAVKDRIFEKRYTLAAIVAVSVEYERSNSQLVASGYLPIQQNSRRIEWALRLLERSGSGTAICKIYIPLEVAIGLLRRQCATACPPRPGPIKTKLRSSLCSRWRMLDQVRRLPYSREIGQNLSECDSVRSAGSSPFAC